MPSAGNAQRVVRARNLQFLEKHRRHVVVEMLSGVDDHLADAGRRIVANRP
jgi:hypothetical protein